MVTLPSRAIVKINRNKLFQSNISQNNMLVYSYSHEYKNMSMEGMR